MVARLVARVVVEVARVVIVVLVARVTEVVAMLFIGLSKWLLRWLKEREIERVNKIERQRI